MGMGRSAQLQGWKEFTDNLNPLKRYLGRQVGRPWNKVYSEICENLSVRSTVQQHLRDHLYECMELRAVLAEDGRILNSESHHELCRGELYVHPVNGLLCRYRKGKRKFAKAEKAEEKICVELAEDRALRKISGIWYEVEYAVASPSQEWGSTAPHFTVYDVVECRQVLAVGRFAARKAQLSGKDLKLHDLDNDQD